MGLSLSAFDYIIIGLYFVVLIIIGYISSRKESKEGYLIGERKLTTLLTTSSISASRIGAGILLAYFAFVYLFGISALWYFIGVIVGMIIFYFFAKKLKKYADEKKYYTLSDYFYDKYGRIVGRISAIVVGVSYFFVFVTQIIGGAKVLAVVLNISFIISLAIVCGVILFYLLLGGFKAVVKTDLVQFIALGVLAIVLLIFLLTNFSLDTTQLTFGKFGASNLIAFLLGGILVEFSMADLWRRVYASKDLKTVKRSLILSTLFFFIFAVILTIIGLIIRKQVPGIDPDTALVQGFIHLLPAGFIGIGVVMLFAVVMSSADTFLFTETSIIVQDFISRTKKITKNNSVRIMRLTLSAIMLVAFLLAYFFENLTKTSYLFFATGATISVAVIATWIHKKVRPITLAIGISVGFIATLIYAFVDISPTIAFVGILGTLIGLIIGGVISRIIKS